ncbi:MAG: DNA translocase FtsK 4TM domain-containing protein [Bacteroidales bacterium]|nr:DNA translocase FtsK 4TM domain-containing protein [Bacteroidales bacterium]
MKKRNTKEAKKGKKNATGRKNNRNSFFRDEKTSFIAGLLITGFAVYLFFAFIAYLFWWKADQSFDAANVISGAEIQVNNWSGKSGAWFADIFINKGFGLAAFFIPVLLAALGLRLLHIKKIKALNISRNLVLGTIIFSVILSYIFGHANGMLGSGPGGAHGFFVSQWLNAFLGKLGTGILLLIISLSYLLLVFNLKPSLKSLAFVFPRLRKQKEEIQGDVNAGEEGEKPEPDFHINRPGDDEIITEEDKDSADHPEAAAGDNEPEEAEDVAGHPIINEVSPGVDSNGVSISITKARADDQLSPEEVEKMKESYDPRLDLSSFKMPPISLLEDHKSDAEFDDSEIIEKKETIVKTLLDYNIKVRHISATVGPTVTLYEVVPERGVRTAKIKSLDNDIALSLSAFGIRIIAPIPGRGTVGIEVPNKRPEIVSMKSLISTKLFQDSKFELAIALGRTITNELLMLDLQKMPHLLVAGATGQGKSVGLNVIIASLLYRKHPAEIKFIMVDPKMVELTLYNKIEKHYLAKLPDTDDPIITETQKVVYTLNSLCIEMGERYKLLRKARVKSIKEYNEVFTKRKLNPENGHKYLPYLVLVIDEFADLIMTAGKEIEGPIQRLSQLARAVGIHLIVATQRPSTNIITGTIKTNFPARLAFRVSSSIDSRTILDSTGAEKLVGRGDMLIYNGTELIRAQCAFIDTPELNRLTEFIASQQGYTEAYILPEYEGETDNSFHEVDLKKRDSLFDEAARLVVQTQQGSTSLIQRKMSLGYNRAGRIVDQLEAAGILGPYEGSKAREVMITDMNSLERILSGLE